MTYFRSLVENGTSSHLKMVISNAFPVGRRRAKDLVKLRCVAGKAFKEATGFDDAPDLTPEQRYCGSLGPFERLALQRRSAVVTQRSAPWGEL